MKREELKNGAGLKPAQMEKVARDFWAHCEGFITAEDMDSAEVTRVIEFKGKRYAEVETRATIAGLGQRTYKDHFEVED